jgi:hypothetical protein
MLKQSWIFQKAQDLTKEGDGLLAQLLRVANIATDDTVEWQSNSVQ